MRTTSDSCLRRTEGISSIVGVILMIVVSVILASVVLGFTLGLTDFLEKPPQAGITVSQEYQNTGPNEGSYSVTIVASSMPNADEVTVEGPATSSTVGRVGGHVTLTGLEEGDLIIVTATKSDQTVVVREYRVG